MRSKRDDGDGPARANDGADFPAVIPAIGDDGENAAPIPKRPEPLKRHRIALVARAQTPGHNAFG